LFTGFEYFFFFRFLGSGKMDPILLLSKVIVQWSPTGKAPWHLTDAQVGRHPGQKLAHSSTAKGRGFLLPGSGYRFALIINGIGKIGIDNRLITKNIHFYLRRGGVKR
jgi:hypothetical protein